MCSCSRKKNDLREVDQNELIYPTLEKTYDIDKVISYLSNTNPTLKQFAAKFDVDKYKRVDGDVSYNFQNAEEMSNESQYTIYALVKPKDADLKDTFLIVFFDEYENYITWDSLKLIDTEYDKQFENLTIGMNRDTVYSIESSSLLLGTSSGSRPVSFHCLKNGKCYIIEYDRNYSENTEFIKSIKTFTI